MVIDGPIVAWLIKIYGPFVNSSLTIATFGLTFEQFATPDGYRFAGR